MPIEGLELFVVVRQLYWAVKLGLGPALGYSMFSDTLYRYFYSAPSSVLQIFGISPSLSKFEMLWALPIIVIATTHLVLIFRDIGRTLATRTVEPTARLYTGVALLCIYASQATGFYYARHLDTIMEAFIWYSVAMAFIVWRLRVRNVTNHHKQKQG